MTATTALSPRQDLLRIQKKIFARNDELIRSQAIVRERSFERYERQYKRHVRDFESVSSWEDLVRAIGENDIIYMGDYHTNPQSQRTLLRLLKQIVGLYPQPLGIGLELVLKKHQGHLNDLLNERISEETFLEKIRFRKYWYFDLWKNFKPLFDFARFHQLPLFGIEYSLGGIATLEKRDRESSKVIASLVTANPGMKLIVFVGDLHIAPGHLPREVTKVLGAKGLRKKQLMIYQNSESIYWKLSEEEIEDKVEIVRLSPSEFCIINTPPIVWQQSYLNWLEHEEGEIDFADAPHSFFELLQQIAKFLDIQLPPEADEVEVFTCGDLSFLKTLSEDGDFSRADIKRIKKQILASESYCIPQKRCVYLANLSINHASEEAAHYLKFLCGGMEETRDPVDAFYANAVHEAMGFFGSKIINHKRKCFHEKEYQGLIRYLTSSRIPSGRKMELEISLLVLKHRALDKKGIPIRSPQFYRLRHEIFFGVTHSLGYMLGDRLYYALVEGRITREEIREVFRNSMRKEGEAYELYRRLWRKVRGVKIPRRA